MSAFLPEHANIIPFLLVTLGLGGWTAWMTGRAVALGWGPAWQAIVYCALIAAASRFIHFALFREELLSVERYLLDFVVLSTIGWLGFRMKRVRQMTTQYRWLYERSGPLSWRDKRQPEGGRIG